MLIRIKLSVYHIERNQEQQQHRSRSKRERRKIFVVNIELKAGDAKVNKQTLLLLIEF